MIMNVQADNGGIQMKGLNGNQLKLIAVITMAVDHIGFGLVNLGCLMPRMEAGLPYQDLWIFYWVLRTVGRLAFPIFCFLLLEGFLHTRDRKLYALRLGAFAVISEIPYDLMVSHMTADWSAQNVFFTLLLGLIMMKVLERAGASKLPVNQNLFLQLAVIVLFCCVAWLLRTDYSYIGIMLIAILYWFRDSRLKQCVIGFIWLSLMEPIPWLIPGFAAGYLCIYFYNGQRGRWGGKYIFYLFYPVHLLAIAWIYYLMF